MSSGGSTCTPTRWSTTRSLNVNFHHAINFGALCGETFLAQLSRFRDNETLEFNRVDRVQLRKQLKRLLSRQHKLLHKCFTITSETSLRSKAGSYLRRIDSCITQLKAQGPSRTCKESKEEQQEGAVNFFAIKQYPLLLSQLRV